MVIGQEQAESALALAVRNDRVSHAYLFAGPESVGKHTAALLLAQAVSCAVQGAGGSERVGVGVGVGVGTDGALTPTPTPTPTRPEALLPPDLLRLAPCRMCDSCRRIAAGTHPDVHVIVPGSKGGQNISVEQMREVRQDVARRPIMGRRKFYLVPSAEAMNEEAANTLLKTLEEPPPGVTLVLMATSPTRVLPTIRSRCQVVRFGLVKTDTIRDWLTEQGLPAAAAEELALTAGGRPGLALRWSRDPEALARRRQVLELMADVAPLRERSRQRPAEALAALRLAERARALVGPDESGSEYIPGVPVAATPGNPKSKIQNPKSEDESAPRPAKSGFLRLLEIARSYYRDLLLLAQGAPEELVYNADALPALRKSAGSYTPAELLSALEAMGRCQQFLERNVQPQLALETLFLELTATNGAAPR